MPQRTDFYLKPCSALMWKKFIALVVKSFPKEGTELHQQTLGRSVKEPYDALFWKLIDALKSLSLPLQNAIFSQKQTMG